MPKMIRYVLVVVLVIAGLVCMISPRLTGYGAISEKASEVIEGALKENAKTFIVISGLKAGLAVVEGSTVGAVLLDVEIGWTYYKGNEFSLLYNYRDIRKELDADINPRKGRSLYVGATYSLSQLDSGEFEYGLQPIYDDNNFGRYELIYEEHIPLPYWRHSLSLMLRGGVIDNLVDSFFYIYMGSRDRVRGYSYYSIEGRKMLLGRF